MNVQDVILPIYAPYIKSKVFHLLKEHVFHQFLGIAIVKPGSKSYVTMAQQIKYSYVNRRKATINVKSLIKTWIQLMSTLRT